jgi:hypothetical protein
LHEHTAGRRVLSRRSARVRISRSREREEEREGKTIFLFLEKGKDSSDTFVADEQGVTQTCTEDMLYPFGGWGRCCG